MKPSMRQDNQLDISVVIPVKNESASLAACLKSILAQTVPVREIIVIDSGSTDGTPDIARSFERVRLIEIEPGEFNHGDTRNLGVREASGEFIVFTVGDARPVDGEWLDHLLRGFVSNDVVVVSGSQIVPEEDDTNPLKWFKPQSKPTLRIWRYNSRSEFEAASPQERHLATSLDNVTAAYRRSALLELPFRRIVYGEDILFAKDVLESGKAIAFQPAARVFHYHQETYSTLFKRTIAVASLRYQLTGYEPPESAFWSSYIRDIARLLADRRLHWSQKIRWAKYNYSTRKAVNDGLRKVRQARLKGGSAMQDLHEAYCGTPPIPLKKPA